MLAIAEQCIHSVKAFTVSCTLPTSKLVGSGQEMRREGRWDSWPKLTQRDIPCYITTWWERKLEGPVFQELLLLEDWLIAFCITFWCFFPILLIKLSSFQLPEFSHFCSSDFLPLSCREGGSEQLYSAYLPARVNPQQVRLFQWICNVCISLITYQHKPNILIKYGIFNVYDSLGKTLSTWKSSHL